MFDILQHRPARTTRHVITLIVDADEIDLLSLVLQRYLFLPQQPHSMPMEERLRGIFCICINFVIAIASPGSQRCPKLAQFGDTVFQRIVLAADEISGNNREIGAEIIREAHGAPYFLTRHEVADVNVAELRYFKTFQAFWKASVRNLDPSYSNPQRPIRETSNARTEVKAPATPH